MEASGVAEVTSNVTQVIARAHEICKLTAGGGIRTGVCSMDLHSFWALGAVVVLAAIAIVFQNRRRPEGPARPGLWPLEPVPMLLSRPGQMLYARLKEALPQYTVFAQVRLRQILRLKRGSRDRSVTSRFNQLSIDFLIVRADTSIVCAVELDDAAHGRLDRRDADARKARALESAGIPLLRWNARQLPDVVSIQRAFNSTMPETQFAESVVSPSSLIAPGSRG